MSVTRNVWQQVERGRPPAAAGLMSGCRRHRAVECRTFLTTLDAQGPAALGIHAIMDHYGTHKTAIIRRWFARHPRFHAHFTPTHASWLNLVERWFAAPETKPLPPRHAPQRRCARDGDS